MRKQYLLLFIVLQLAVGSMMAQESINGFDADGLRHGLWTKQFDKTNQPRYEGHFEHGKEIGVFKFYTLSKGVSVLSGTKTFKPNEDTIAVAFFSSKGRKISEGKMIGNLFIGEWTYFHNNSEVMMSKEFYNDNGLLDGVKKVFYKTGKIAEKANYKDGKLDGISEWFAENGQLIKTFIYKSDELHGLSKVYNDKGQILAEGFYKNDRKDGIWKFYEDGQLTEEKDFTVRSKNPKKQ